MKHASASAAHSLRQYLARHAVAEIAWAEAISEQYRAVLVVPAYLEPAGLLERYQPALESATGRVLVVVVVNAARANAEQSWPTHRDLIADLRGSAARCLGSEQGWLARRAHADVLVIDRAHPDRCLPDGEGVGLARRIGCDLALALHARGQLEDPFIYCTDADAELPAGYFAAAIQQPAAAGLLFSFWHEAGADADIDAATALYELGLRYYVEGLAAAGSPFAYHSIGSTLAVQAAAYAAVRGFPKRLAGEDFYLLNKLAKVGALLRVDSVRIRLASRASLRTPHGTGVRAVELAGLEQLEAAPFYHPGIFPLLALWLEALAEFAKTRQLSAVRAGLRTRAGSAALALESVLDDLGVWPVLEQAARHCHGETALATRLHTWFDAFRTLKFVHALRERGWASVPFRQALEGAGWFSAEQARSASVDELRCWFVARESQRSPWLGIHRHAASGRDRAALSRLGTTR